MKISPKKFIKTIKVLPKKLARHSFLTFLIFLFLDFTLGGIVFYKYVILIEKTKVETLRTPLRFDMANYQEVLNQWEKRQKNLEKIDSKQYINPFQETRIAFSTSPGVSDDNIILAVFAPIPETEISRRKISRSSLSANPKS